MKKIKVKGIIDEDFVNYKLPSMTIMFPKCSFKCGKRLCQNSKIARMADIEVPLDALVRRYANNPITKAIVCQGLEPMDSFEDVLDILMWCRLLGCKDDFVIYTGYDKFEVSEQISQLQHYSNVIVKYGRYLPGQEPHLDEVLGVELASENQWAERLHGEVGNDRNKLGRW